MIPHGMQVPIPMRLVAYQRQTAIPHLLFTYFTFIELALFWKLVQVALNPKKKHFGDLLLVCYRTHALPISQIKHESVDHERTKGTRSSATTDGPRDMLRQSKSYQVLRDYRNKLYNKSTTNQSNGVKSVTADHTHTHIHLTALFPGLPG